MRLSHLSDFYSSILLGEECEARASPEELLNTYIVRRSGEDAIPIPGMSSVLSRGSRISIEQEEVIIHNGQLSIEPVIDRNG